MKTQWLYDIGNYDELSKVISELDWDFIDEPDNDVDDVAQEFCDKLNSLLKLYIPTRQFYLRPNDADWMTSDIRTNQRRRDRLHKQAKSKNTPAAWYAYRSQRNKVNSMIRSAKRSYTNKFFSEINDRSPSK